MASAAQTAGGGVDLIHHIPHAVQWVKDPVLQLWHRLQLWLGSHPWPQELPYANSAAPQKTNKQKPTKLISLNGTFFFRDVNTSVLLARSYLVFSLLIAKHSISILAVLFFFFF